MAKIEKFLWPSSSQRGEDSGEKKVFLISTFFARVAGKIVSLPSNLPRNMALLRHFLVRLTLRDKRFISIYKKHTIFLNVFGNI